MANAEMICPACGKRTLKLFHKIGRYRCTDADCGEDFAPERVETIAVPPAKTDFLEPLPFPVAYPLAHARDGRLPARDRVANSIFAAYQAMRTTALLLLADYLACDTVCRELQGPIRGLRLPHWGEWSLLCDRLCQFWSGRLQERPERETHFPRLVAGWLEVNRKGRLPKSHSWTGLLAGLPGLQGPSAWSPNDALWKARNDRAHREGTRTVEEGAERDALPRLLTLSEILAERLFPPGELTLWRRVSDASGVAISAIRLHGPHPDLRFDLHGGPEAAALSWGASGLLAATPTGDLSVYPLFVPLDPEGAGQELRGGGLIEPVGLVDGIGQKKIAVLGVRSHCELSELAGPIQSALTRKEVQLGFKRDQTKRWSLVNWSAVTADDTLNALRGRKYFPEVYLERTGVDGLVREVLDRPGRGLLLLGEAGAGKSSLLARLVDGLLAADREEDETQPWTDARRGAGDVVLFLSGADAYKGDAAWSGRQILCEAVLRRAGIESGAFKDLDDLWRHLEATVREDQESDRRVWLVLDALNEADRFTDLLRALDDVLPAVERYPWLRLAISLRSGAYQSLAQRHRDLLQHGTEVLINARYLASFTDARNQEIPYLDVRPFSAEEAAAAYALRQRRLPEQSCPVPHDSLEPGLRALLAQPLYLHLFHETFRDRTEPPQNLDEGRLIGAYLDRLQADLPGIVGHLERLGRLMYERRIPILPMEEADAWVAEWRARLGADNALRVVKLDPVEELVAASLLMRPAEDGEGIGRRITGYGFTQQRLCEQVLLRELNRQIRPRALPSADEFLAWARQAGSPDVSEAEDFHELTGALETVSAELALVGNGEVLSVLLELEGERVRTRLLGSALQAQGPMGRTDIAAVEGTLAPLFAAAAAGVDLGERLVVSGLQVERCLIERGYSPVAAVVGRGCLDIIRALVAQDSEGGNRRLWLVLLLNAMGDHAQQSGDGAVAAGYFKESLEIMRALVAQEPGCTDVRWELATSLANMGGLAFAEGDMIGARGYFAEELEINRALVAQEPGRADLRGQLAASLDNLGGLAFAEGDMIGARGYFAEELEISRALVAQERGRVDMRGPLARSLDNLGKLTVAEGDMIGARGYFSDALANQRARVAQEPGRVDLMQNLWDSLNGLGNLSIETGDGSGARCYLAEALEISRALVTQEPGRVDLRQRLATSLNNLGQPAFAEGDGVGARGYGVESLEILRALAEKVPGRVGFRSNLAASLNNLGNLAIAEGDKIGARVYVEESLEILRALVAQQPGGADFRSNLAASLSPLGKLVLEEGDGVGARGYLDESEEILRALVAQQPGDARLRLQLAASLNNLGNLAIAEGDKIGARVYVEESVEILRALVAKEPGRADLIQNLWVSLNTLGELALAEGEGVGARGHVEESVEILRALVAQEPGSLDLSQNLAVSLRDLGDMALDSDDGAGAQGYLAESVEILRALVAQATGSTELRQNLAVSLIGMGRLALDSDDEAEAHGYFAESLVILRALVAQEPEDEVHRVYLAIIYWNLSAVAEPQNERYWLERILETLQPLRERAVPHGDWDQIWDKAIEALRQHDEDH